MRLIYLLVAFCVASAPAVAQSKLDVPNWQELEDYYAGDGSVHGAQERVTRAIPPGTPTRQAVAALEKAGATCKFKARSQTPERCLIHQYSLADGAADDIRWTVFLGTKAGDVSAISLERYVDRHGSD
jgi:hypothetical protein